LPCHLPPDDWKPSYWTLSFSFQGASRAVTVNSLALAFRSFPTPDFAGRWPKRILRPSPDRGQITGHHASEIESAQSHREAGRIVVIPTATGARLFVQFCTVIEATIDRRRDLGALFATTAQCT
jgi:hypothetical protein